LIPLQNEEKGVIEALILENQEILSSQARKFAHSNPTHIADYNDYYQEACVILMKVWRNYDRKKGNWQNYLITSLINELSKFSSQCNSSLSVNSNAVQLSVKIFSLESEGFTKTEIIKKLGISNKRFHEVKSILTREVLADSAHTNKYKAKEVIEEIKSSLDGEDLIIFNLCLEDATIMQISKQLNYSHETARRRLHSLFDKIRTMFNDERSIN
jgi:RNA polymerase sigma factor (sigma-70 family)